MAKTIEEAAKGVISEILDYDARKDRFEVLFKMPDGSTVKDSIPKSYLREGNPTSVSQMEKDFWDKKSKKRVQR